MEEEIFKFIKDKFEPAAGFADADFYMTTQEVVEQLLEFFPSGEISFDTVFTFLKGNGFVFDNIGTGMSPKWLFKNR